MLIGIVCSDVEVLKNLTCFCSEYGNLITFSCLSDFLNSLRINKVFDILILQESLISYDKSILQRIKEQILFKRILYIKDAVTFSVSNTCSERILLKTALGLKNIIVSEILVIEKLNRKIYIRLEDGSILQLYYSKLSDVSNKLNSNFFVMINRSTLINLLKIAKFDKNIIRMIGLSNNYFTLTKKYKIIFLKKWNSLINKKNGI